MTSTTSKILELALALPKEEREALVDAITESLDRTQQGLSNAWVSEVARRIETAERGESLLVEGAQVEERLRATLRRLE